jgi:hypothetical protein
LAAEVAAAVAEEEAAAEEEARLRAAATAAAVKAKAVRLKAEVAEAVRLKAVAAVEEEATVAAVASAEVFDTLVTIAVVLFIGVCYLGDVHVAAGQLLCRIGGNIHRRRRRRRCRSPPSPRQGSFCFCSFLEASSDCFVFCSLPPRGIGPIRPANRRGGGSTSARSAKA